MRETMRARLPWIAATLLVASLVHMGSLYLLPRLVMHRAFERLGTPNMMHYGKRPDASARAVVRPSPDVIYAICSYDLSKGPLRVTTALTHSNYWSVSAFDAATNNFFVRDDQQIAGDSFEILMVKRGQALPSPGKAPEHAIVFSPSERGVILLRTVIDDDKNIPALEALLHQSTCETVAPAKTLR